MATSPEALLISSILLGRDYNVATMGGITQEMFTAYPEEWAWLENYVMRRKRIPSKLAFKTQFPDFAIKNVNDTAHYSDEVRKHFARRQLTKSMSNAADCLADGSLTEALDTLRSTAIQVGATLNGVQDKNLATDWQSIYDEVAGRVERYEKYGKSGVPTGFETFDDRTGGVAPGQLVVVGARLGEGKSWTLIRMSMAAIMEGHRVHYSSLEMSNAEVGMRLHNFLSGQIGKQVFQAELLAQGRDFDLNEYKSFLRSIKGAVKGQMTMSDTRNIGLAEIAAQIERHKPEVYFLDYLTLARMGGEGGWKDIGDFTKGLKDLAKDAGVTIISAAQLNRSAAQGRGPADTDTIGGSDQIGQDADIIITMKKRSETVTQYKVVKNRAGRSGFSWYANLDMDRGIFQEVSGNTALDLIDRDKDRDGDDD